MSPLVEISVTPENVHFPARNPSGTDIQFAAKWTPKNDLMYHSKLSGAAEKQSAPLGGQLAYTFSLRRETKGSTN